MNRYHITTLACTFIIFSFVFSPAVSLGQQKKITQKIVGGKDAQRGAWPFIAALVYADEDPFSGQFCGGSLIGSKWVATAAHCVFETGGTVRAPTAMDVLLGIHDLANDTESTDFVRFKVQRIVPHPSYDPNAGDEDNDIALLELTSETSAYTTIPRITGDATLEGETATAIGWGDTAATDPENHVESEYPNILQQVALPIISNATCDLANADEKITANMLCAGFSGGGKDSCKGDSGGPLVVMSGGVWKLAGIVSWGTGCAEPGAYGVYARVSKFSEFIAEYAGAQPETPGDVSQDGVTDITDVLLIIDIIFGAKIPGEGEGSPENGDANQDGTTDITDVLFVIDIIFGN